MPRFPFGFEGGMWDLIVLIPNHCLSIYYPTTDFSHTCTSFIGSKVPMITRL